MFQQRGQCARSRLSLFLRDLSFSTCSLVYMKGTSSQLILLNPRDVTLNP